MEILVRPLQLLLFLTPTSPFRQRWSKIDLNFLYENFEKKQILSPVGRIYNVQRLRAATSKRCQ